MSGIADDSNTKQISMLLYYLGEEAEAILASKNATEDEGMDYAKFVEKTDFFKCVRTLYLKEQDLTDDTNKQAKAPNILLWPSTNSPKILTTECSRAR